MPPTYDDDRDDRDDDREDGWGEEPWDPAEPDCEGDDGPEEEYDPDGWERVEDYDHIADLHDDDWRGDW